MIAEIKKILVNNALDKELKLKDRDDSSCASDLIVTDYDEVVKRFSKILKINQPSSCDCLYFDSDKNELVFIEMRRLNNLFRNEKHKFTNPKDFNTYIQAELCKDYLGDKIIDSFSLLTAIIGYYNAGKLYSYLFKNNKGDHIKIRYILLTDLSNADWHYCFLGNAYGFIKQYKYKFLTNAAFIRCEDLHKFLN